MNCYKQPKRTLKTCESNKLSKTTITIHFNRLQVCAIQASFWVCSVIYTCTFSGAPSDGFLLNPLKTLFRLSRVLLDLHMHSKRRYKICICSVILGQPESFPNYKGLSIIFPKILDAIWRDTKVGHFQIPLSIPFLNSQISCFLFSMKNSLTWAVKSEKLNFTKS